MEPWKPEGCLAIPVKVQRYTPHDIRTAAPQLNMHFTSLVRCRRRLQSGRKTAGGSLSRRLARRPRTGPSRVPPRDSHKGGCRSGTPTQQQAIFSWSSFSDGGKGDLAALLNMHPAFHRFKARWELWGRGSTYQTNVMLDAWHKVMVTCVSSMRYSQPHYMLAQ